MRTPGQHLPEGMVDIPTVWALPGQLRALGVSNSKSALYGAFVWARGALNSPKRWIPARADQWLPLRVVEQLHRRGPAADRRRPADALGGPPAARPLRGARYRAPHAVWIKGVSGPLGGLARPPSGAAIQPSLRESRSKPCVDPPHNRPPAEPRWRPKWRRQRRLTCRPRSKRR